MALPSSHILPSSAFRHIGFMVLFMAVIAGFSALGLLTTQTVTKSWIQDTQNKMTLEILAFDEEEKVVFDQQRIEQNLAKIQKIIDGDPIIVSVDVTRFDNADDIDKEYQIPSPIFMTFSLHPDRAKNAEQRIMNEIKENVVQTIFKKPEIWQADINRTALTFRFAFISLAIGVFFVTSLVLSATIRTQLQASDKTLKLIYLMGADVSIIVSLFQRALIKPIIWGGIIGLICTGFLFSPAVVFLNIEIQPLLFYGYLCMIFLTFVVVSYIITSFTVRNALKTMP